MESVKNCDIRCYQETSIDRSRLISIEGEVIESIGSRSKF